MQVLSLCSQTDRQLVTADHLKDSKFDLEISKKRSLLLGGHTATKCTSSVSRCSLLSPVMPPKDNTDSRGFPGTLSHLLSGGVCLPSALFCHAMLHVHGNTPSKFKETR